MAITENCQNWKLLELKAAKIESCQNCKLPKLQVVKIENCQNWLLPKLKIVKNCKFNTSNRVSSATSSIGPDTQQIDDKISGKFHRQHLWDNIKIGNESRLENDRNIGGVKQLDGVGRVLSTITGTLDGQVHTESL